MPPKGKSKAAKSKASKKSKEPIMGITKGSIKRLAKRAGAPRVTSTLYDSLRDVIVEDLQRLLKTVTVYAVHAKRKTASASDVISAARLCGHPLVSSNTVKTFKNDKRKKRAKNESTAATSPKSKGKSKSKKSRGGEEKSKRHYSSGTLAIRDINRAQKGSSFLIRKEPFKRLVRTISSEFVNLLHKVDPNNYESREDLRISARAFTFIQVYEETLLVKLLRGAFDVTLNGNRSSIQGKDLMIIRRANGKAPYISVSTR